MVVFREKFNSHHSHSLVKFEIYFLNLFLVYKREQQPGDRRGEAADPKADDKHDRERPEQRLLQDRRGPGEYIVPGGD